MIGILLGIFTRIVSNSYLNVFQKILTNRGIYSSVINFYTYFGLLIIGFIICPNPIFTTQMLSTILIMGFLGALGNYFIIKALSCGELSALAPINSYKPIVALCFGILLLSEIPTLQEIIAILLIIFGTFVLGTHKIFYAKATLYRFFALFFSGTEAIFIKKVIILSNITSAFLYWALAGFLFSLIFLLISKHKVIIQKSDIKYQLALIIMVAIMQYTTNYVFSKINVAHALALFQLSTVISVFLGVNIFKEKDLIKKLVATIIMVIGAIILILS